MQRPLIRTGSKITKFLTNPMEESTCCEADGSSASQEITLIRRKAEAH